ncbi:MAG: metallophosphoesterase [Intestinimonas sp.]|jgi:protein phosphatase|nr:metallophosphoesterase [Intestinimonas sp.]
MKAAVHRVMFPPERRVIAISDIHGNLPWLTALLDKVAFSRDDILVLVGDLMEKGPYSLDTLRAVMELSAGHTVYTVAGNCDTLAINLEPGGSLPEPVLKRYLAWHPESVLFQMAAACGLSFQGSGDFDVLRKALEEHFGPELAFLRAMPTILDAGDYVFVHGGVPSMEHMEKLDAWGCMKNDAFLEQGYSFDRWCVVGHWPVTLYRETIPRFDPILDRKRRIASIDGGCCVVAGGQLNALILPSAPGEDFKCVHWDSYPVAEALDAQKASRDPVTIRWMDHGVTVLRSGREFSLCRHNSSGRVLPVLNRYLRRQHGGGTWCEDSTDYQLEVLPGDQLSVVEETSQGALVKKNGTLGWYLGRLRQDREAPLFFAKI